MSLWTPDGERPVRRQPAAEPPRPTAAEPPRPTDLRLEDLSEEERKRAEALASELAEVRAQVAATPAEVIVTNHLMGFYELAAIHLSQQPPNLSAAALAIDAFTAVLERLRGRLGDAETTLRDALSQLQLAFVELQGRAEHEA
jgi:hypothetical protein